MSHLHHIIHEIAQNPSQLKEILATASTRLTAEEKVALQSVVGNGSLALSTQNLEQSKQPIAMLLNMWIRPEI